MTATFYVGVTSFLWLWLWLTEAFVIGIVLGLLFGYRRWRL